MLCLNMSLKELGFFFKESYSLEEILLAVDAVAPAEALVRQLGLAVAAFQALAVPVAIQHFEDEAVHDVLIAAGTHWNFCRNRETCLLFLIKTLTTPKIIMSMVTPVSLGKLYS